MKYAPRMNRYERRQMQSEKLKQDLSGSGVYIYENNSDGDLKLPKATDKGIRTVGPRKRFEGDSYYLKLVGSPMNLLKLVEVVVPQLTHEQILEKQLREQQEETMQQKLILDQPDQITHQGKVEHVANPNQVPMQPLNDTTNPNQTQPEVLLTEDPLDGVEIILG